MLAIRGRNHDLLVLIRTNVSFLCSPLRIGRSFGGNLNLIRSNWPKWREDIRQADLISCIKHMTYDTMKLKVEVVPQLA